MGARLEELDWQATPLGVLSLRRRRDPVTGGDVFEVKLDEDYLMSSLYTAAEVEVARAALAMLTESTGDGPAGPDAAGDGGDAAAQPWLDVVVGGLGLGYTAEAVLSHPQVREVVVVEALGPVIGWHERGLLPASVSARRDPRCRLVEGDFFALAASADGLDPRAPARRFHAVVVDIDHSPRHLLHPRNASFYQDDGIARLAGHLHPGGVFALWSNDPPDGEYQSRLARVFDDVRAEVVTFPSQVEGGRSTNTVYLARARR